MRKSAIREHRRRMKQFVRDARGALNCQLIPAEVLLYRATVSPCGFTAKVEAFHQWSATAIRSTPGDGPLCLTCDIEFGPGRAVPAAFWFQSPFAKWSKATVISGVCSACFARADCVDRILAGMRQRIPDLQVMPATTQ